MRNQKVSGAVWWAALKDVDNAVREAVPWDVDDAVGDTMNDAVWGSDAVDEVVHEIVYRDPTSPALQDFLQEACVGGEAG